MSIDLTTLSAREVLSAVYIGYYNRAADAAGMQFWEQVIANTSLDLEAIATDFAGQSETQAVHPFFSDPATSTPSTFITSLYQNLFNRDADEAGLEFWSEQLQSAIDGTGTFSVGEIIVKIIEGAVDVDGGTQDRTTILNKIEVAQDWTDAAEANNGAFDAAAMANAKEVIADVTSDPATVVDAKAATDAFFEATPPTNPGDTFFLESKTDVIEGTENDDQFNAYLQQNPNAGGISNSLSSADRLDGGAGNDRLYAELTKEFLGASGANSQATDIQPRLTNIEEIDIEARDDTQDGANADDTIIVDAKHITDHVEIGSYYSDGDLKIENLTTLTAAGTTRNTSEITVTMDHTDNFNTDGDASDLEVLFDNDYLLSGQEAEGMVFYHLLDEDAELAGLTNRLDNIDVDGLRFNITNADGSVTQVTLNDPAAQTAGTHQGFVNALQDALQALIADGTLPAGTTLTLDPTNVDTTFLDDGSESDDIPAIVLTTGDGSSVEATGFARVEEAIGEYDVYGRFGEVNEVQEQPISIDIDLHKTGRGGDGGNLIVGGKTGETQPGIADGIEVFNIDVLGAGSDDPDGAAAKPSSLGTVTSTGNELNTVMIATAAEFVAGSTHASLEIRDGFNAIGSTVENGDLQLVNADGFLGDLYLGTDQAIINLDTLTAQGGGDVTFNGRLDGNEVNQAYSFTTGGGSDTVALSLDGDALDYAGASVNVFTNGGDDSIVVAFDPDPEDTNNHQLNQAVLNNVHVDAGAGADTITVDGVGVANILAGDGNDTVYTDGAGVDAIWALNFDNARVDATTGGLGGTSGVDDLPGVPTSLAYIGGATVTVTLSGAGGVVADGGGIMSAGAAVNGDNGYESSVVIGNLLNGNDYYGDQRDVNAAIMEAINDDAVLSKLLTASMGSNNTLVVTSKTSGNFNADDLRVGIAQRDLGVVANWDPVEAEARSVYSDSSIDVTTLATADGAAGRGVSIDAAGEANAWYDGLSNAADTVANNQAIDNLYQAGTADVTENDNVIDGGAGDDVIVLSTDAVAGATIAFTPNGARSSLINGASNETIVLTGGNIGDDTVMNFTSGTSATAGIDFLDYSAYLTSLMDVSANSGAADTADSHVSVPVTLDGDTSSVAANEVSVITYDPTSATDWANLGAADVAELFNTSAASGNYDGLAASTFSVRDNYTDDQLVNGAAKAIVMIENADNDGEYKVFELSWNGSNASSVDHTVAVNDLGSLDFGESLGLDATNLVGSAEYSALLDNGFGGVIVTPPGGATVVDLSGETAVTGVVGTAEIFTLSFDSSSGNALSSDAVVSLTNFTVGEDILRFDDANGTPQDAATFLNGAGGAVVASNGFAGETTISFQDDNAADAIPAAQVTLVGITDATLGGGTPFFEVV